MSLSVKKCNIFKKIFVLFLTISTLRKCEQSQIFDRWIYLEIQWSILKLHRSPTINFMFSIELIILVSLAFLPMILGMNFGLNLTRIMNEHNKTKLVGNLVWKKLFLSNENCTWDFW